MATKNKELITILSYYPTIFSNVVVVQKNGVIRIRKNTPKRRR